MKLALVPLGDVPRDLVTRLAARLRAFGEPVVLPARALPGTAHDPRRDQFRSEHLLRALREVDAPRVLGIAAVDLYADSLNFVFGQADVGGKAAVISTARLRSDDGDRFDRRVLTEAVHELGHTLGLGHCARDGCVMRFSNTLEDTDRKGVAFCPGCRAALPSGLGVTG